MPHHVVFPLLKLQNQKREHEDLKHAFDKFVVANDVREEARTVVTQKRDGRNLTILAIGGTLAGFLQAVPSFLALI